MKIYMIYTSISIFFLNSPTDRPIVQWMAVSVSPHCPETMPDVDHKPFQSLLSGPYVRGQCISRALRDHCLPNLIFDGSSYLTTHSSVHASMITVSWEKHPGSYNHLAVLFSCSFYHLINMEASHILNVDISTRWMGLYWVWNIV